MNTPETEIQVRRRIFKHVWNAVRDYGMIQGGDRILIGLSGGKDSLLLVDTLAGLVRSFRPAVTLHAVHVVLKGIPYKASPDYLADWCGRRSVAFSCREAALGNPARDAAAGTGEPGGDNPCFICSWTRRKTLFDAAAACGCNKLALGHHLDDVLETLLMNQVFQGSFSTIPPVLRMHKFNLTIIRPFYTVPEADLTAAAALAGLQKQETPCPFEHASHRTDIKRMLAELTRMNPEVRQSMFRAMHNILPEYLPPAPDARTRHTGPGPAGSPQNQS